MIKHSLQTKANWFIQSSTSHISGAVSKSGTVFANEVYKD